MLNGEDFPFKTFICLISLLEATLCLRLCCCGLAEFAPPKSKLLACSRISSPTSSSLRDFLGLLPFPEILLRISRVILFEFSRWCPTKTGMTPVCDIGRRTQVWARLQIGRPNLVLFDRWNKLGPSVGDCSDTLNRLTRLSVGETSLKVALEGLVGSTAAADVVTSCSFAAVLSDALRSSLLVSGRLL